MLVALVLRAGTHEQLRAHGLSFFHLTLAVVVILQDHVVQLLSRVVADGIKGDVVIFLPPWKKKARRESTAIYLGTFDIVLGSEVHVV